jgi:hypothetical protein
MKVARILPYIPPLRAAERDFSGMDISGNMVILDKNHTIISSRPSRPPSNPIFWDMHNSYERTPDAASARGRLEVGLSRRLYCHARHGEDWFEGNAGKA